MYHILKDGFDNKYIMDVPSFRADVWLSKTIFIYKYYQ